MTKTEEREEQTIDPLPLLDDAIEACRNASCALQDEDFRLLAQAKILEALADNLPDLYVRYRRSAHPVRPTLPESEQRDDVISSLRHVFRYLTGDPAAQRKGVTVSQALDVKIAAQRLSTPSTSSSTWEPEPTRALRVLERLASVADCGTVQEIVEALRDACVNFLTAKTEYDSDLWWTTLRAHAYILYEDWDGAGNPVPVQDSPGEQNNDDLDSHPPNCHCYEHEPTFSKRYLNDIAPAVPQDTNHE